MLKTHGGLSVGRFVGSAAVWPKYRLGPAALVYPKRTPSAGSFSVAVTQMPTVLPMRMKLMNPTELVHSMQMTLTHRQEVAARLQMVYSPLAD